MKDDRIVNALEVIKVYGTDRGVVQALRGIDLIARRGTVTAIMGPSGSGKSSMLRIIAGIDTPTAGTVTIANQPISHLRTAARRRVRRRHISYVRQRPQDNLIAGLTIRQQLHLVARHRHTPSTDIRPIIERLGLDDRIDHTPDRLSGGEQQRVALAAATLGGTGVIIADEPTAELDEATTRIVGDLLRQTAAHTGAAIIVASHDPILIRDADHVILIRDGTMQSETVKGEILAVIDSIGRIQLPPHVLEWFPTQRGKLRVDPGRRTIELEAP